MPPATAPFWEIFGKGLPDLHQPIEIIGVPYRIRTGVAAVRGRCPGPLDEGDEARSVIAVAACAIKHRLLHADHSRKFTYCSGCSILRLRATAMAACRSSRFLPTTRTSSPCTDTWTFSLLSLSSRISCLARLASTPCRTITVCFNVLPDAFSGDL